MLGKRSTIVFLAVLTFIAACAYGCGKPMSSEERIQRLAQVEAEKQATAEAVESAEARLEAANATGSLQAAKNIKIELNLYKAALAKAEAEIAGLKNPQPDGSFDWASAISTLGGLLPPPYNAIGLIGGIVGTTVQTYRRRKATEEAEKAANVSHAIVNAIDTAKAANPTLEAAIKDSAKVIRAELAKVDGADEFVEAARV